MTALDVETVEGPGGEMYVRVPDGHVLCLVSKETAEKHAEWRECAAVRIVTCEDGTVGESRGRGGFGVVDVAGGRVVTLLRQSGTYQAIVADPPWPFRWDGRPGGQRRNATPMTYKLMTLEEIAGLPVADLAAPDAHLYLWVTPELHRNGEGVKVAEAWGFRVVHEIIWAKPNFGMGAFPRHQHEPLLVCRRGDLPFALRDVGSVQRWSQPYLTTTGTGTGKTHSAKPDGALDLVERASPGPYLEMFARRARFGWDYYGDQSLGTVAA